LVLDNSSKKEIVSKFGRSSSDTGSAEVEIAKAADAPRKERISGSSSLSEERTVQIT